MTVIDLVICPPSFFRHFTIGKRQQMGRTHTELTAGRKEKMLGMILLIVLVLLLIGANP
jgi:hypothetical protein